TCGAAIRQVDRVAVAADRVSRQRSAVNQQARGPALMRLDRAGAAHTVGRALEVEQYVGSRHARCGGVVERRRRAG
ncbi:hypothetical protein, partial [Photobacterium sp. DNB22_13_2]